MNKMITAFVLFILFISCSKLIESNSVKIIISEKETPYVGKIVRSIEITNKNTIENIIKKINDYSPETFKFNGTYYISIEYSNKRKIVLRTNGLEFEVIEGIDDIKYFKLKEAMDIDFYFKKLPQNNAK
jgi:hypothetical protein